ncbi:hypothetical protein [Pseudonocardia asaccharolytica]|uniref:DNA primase n=1 Tax=Pseudonocardia asaccharolytica DSM 44247 = NBRC 16224 TaxID=1123024 RepID=A0A511CYF1_9PSEU|nr:hypothetical protein [Pseudonocardia asaccharolytica]GEL17581.1 hypothetical protein PA7_14180 [Pseudonocardia asaccharolytica DSM 44247 = NBRC 16224]
MKCGARIALGVAGGYLLGRTKKMKLALMLGGLAAGQRAGGPSEILAQGTKLVKASPELTRLVDEMRGRLLDAGKGAAMAVATRQVESLTDKVGQRVESLGDLGTGRRRRSEAEEREPEAEEAEEEAAEDGEPDEADETDEAEEEDEEAPRRPARGRGSRASGAKSPAATVKRAAASTAGGAARRGGRTRTQRSGDDG